MTLPRWAFSVRQPWAWAIIHAAPIKDIENRDWRRPNPGLDFRGEFALHASAAMSRGEYEQAVAFMAKIGVVCPPAIDLQRGGLIGTARVTDIVRRHDSPWFMGPLGLVLDRPAPCEFVPVKGQLGFFSWRQCEPGEAAAPARWMLPKPDPVLESKPQGTLL